MIEDEGEKTEREKRRGGMEGGGRAGEEAEHQSHNLGYCPVEFKRTRKLNG